MPELFRLFGFTYYFFSREHMPVHVHVEGKDGYAIYDYEGGRFLQRYAKGIKTSDLRRIEVILEENKETIVDSWKSYFNTKRYGDPGNMV